MKKEMNNKGFSLVELIVVIAIMAVLVGILAPQFLRYVEKSRYQKDVSAVDEVKNACETALADEDVATAAASLIPIGTNTTTLMTIPSGGTYSSDCPQLLTDVQATIGKNNLSFSSKSFKNMATAITIDAKGNTAGGYSISANNIPAK